MIYVERWTSITTTTTTTTTTTIIILFFLLPYEFFTPAESLSLLNFHWSLIDSKSPQISRILLSILADFNNVVIWMFSIQSFDFQLF